MSSQAVEWKRLGSRLREVREYLNLSQQQVAQVTGITRSAISEIEHGRRKVDSLELRKFSKLYKYPVSALLGESAGEQGAEADAISALARAVGDLTEQDMAELVRYAQFLKFNGRLAAGQE